MLTTDKIKVAITNCPLWTHLTPHYSVALLSSCVRAINIGVVNPELEIHFYHQLNESERRNWIPSNGSFWHDRNQVENLYDKYRDSFFGASIRDMRANGVNVFALSVNNSAIHMTRRFVMQIREICPDATIILGGPTSFSAPHLLWDMPEVNAVCLGEGERTLPDYLMHLSHFGPPEKFTGFAIRNPNGELSIDKISPVISDLDTIPFPDYTGYDLSLYCAPGTIATALSRGCVQRCAYCAESPHFGKFRSRSGTSMCLELDHYLKTTGLPQLNVLFNDSMINGNMQALEEFADKVVEHSLPITFGGMAVARKEMTLDVLKKLKNAGCINISFGIESGSPEVLRLMKKKLHTPDTALTVLKDAKEAGISTTVFILLGFPGETEAYFYETLAFLRMAFDYIDNLMVNTILILEGSEIASSPDLYNLNPGFGGGDFRTTDSTNTPEVRKKRQEILYLLFQEKMTLLSEIATVGADPVRRLLDGDSFLKSVRFKQELDAVRVSMSWKITLPLRLIGLIPYRLLHYIRRRINGSH